MNSFSVPSVTIDQLPTGALILDVREPPEWAAGHIEDARHIPMNSVPDRLGELSPDEPLYVICAVGGRSGQVAAWLNRQGFDAINVTGGMHAWDAAGRAMVSENAGPATVL